MLSLRLEIDKISSQSFEYLGVHKIFLQFSAKNLFTTLKYAKFWCFRYGPRKKSGYTKRKAGGMRKFGGKHKAPKQTTVEGTVWFKDLTFL